MALLALGLTINAAEPAPSPPRSDELLLTDPLGRVVRVPTNEVPDNLLPPGGSLRSQIPSAQRGMQLGEPVQRRLEESRQGHEGFLWFPPFQPELLPYLAAQDEFGNTAISPGALIRSTPFDVWPQRAKYGLSEIGLRYSLAQSFTFVSLSDVMQGDHSLGFYTFDFAAKWAVFSAVDSGTAGWISTQIEAKAGLGGAGRTQSAALNLGTLTDPASIGSSGNGFRIPELAWQQSFRHGEMVALAGMVSQGNYLDVNSYANSGRGQFLNSALINSMVLPLPGYNPGVNLQWQPDEHWYFMAGVSAGESGPGTAPWSDFTWDTWSAVGEAGYLVDDLFGLGPGVYRVQPFIARSDGPTQGGLCFNLQQQLGRDAPFGWFGRFGFGGSEVSAGASAQIGTGLVMRGPLASLLPGRDHDAAGIGFVWSQPSASATPTAHENEFVLEAGYVLQLTPTARLQPDLQVVWNPAYNPDAESALVFQLQLDLSW